MGYFRNPYEWAVIEILSQMANTIEYFSEFIILLLFSGLYIHEIRNHITFQLHYQYLVHQGLISPIPPIDYHQLPRNANRVNITTINHVVHPMSNILQSRSQLTYNFDIENNNDNNNMNEQPGLHDIRESGDSVDNRDRNNDERNASNDDNDGNPFSIRPAMPGNNLEYWWNVYNNADNNQSNEDNEMDQMNDIDINEDESEEYDDDDDPISVINDVLLINPNPDEISIATINHVDDSLLNDGLQLRNNNRDHNDNTMVNDIENNGNDEEVDVRSNLDDGNPFLIRPVMPGNNLEYWYNVYNEQNNDHQIVVNHIDDEDDPTSLLNLARWRYNHNMRRQ